MVNSLNAFAVSSAALRAGRAVSPFSSTSKPSFYPQKTHRLHRENLKSAGKTAPATLRRQLLAQKQQMLAQYLEKALPQSYLFHVFASPKGFSSTHEISKSAYKFTSFGFIIHRPAPLSEIFVFLRLPDTQAPLPILNEIRRLKIMGKIVLSVLGIEDLAFHLKSLGIGLCAFPDSYETPDFRRSL